MEKQEIMKFFPFETARVGQIETISHIIDSFTSNKFFILDAPTGTGKSVIGTTVARAMGNSYYITAQKLLQDQLTKDFGESGLYPSNLPLIDLKGRNAYECVYYKHLLNNPGSASEIGLERAREKVENYVDCSKGECKRIAKGKLDYCVENNICPYLKQLNKAVFAKHTLMNFHAFIYQTQLARQRWHSRNLLIIDECHNTEQVLLDYISLTVSDIGFDIDFPELETPEEYLIYFEDIDLMEFIKNKILEAVSVNDDKEEEYWTKQAFKYKNFKEAIMGHETWVHKYEVKEITKGKTYVSIEFKPLFVRNFTHLLFEKSVNVLMMSATILNDEIFTDSLGIKKSDYEYLALPNLFPKENREISFIPSGSMAYKSKLKTMPKMLNDIENLLEIHSDDKGIIHTHNFELTKYVLENIDPKFKHRLSNQIDTPNKNDLLAIHASKPNSVLIAPAFHEGLDLKEDLSRFQIICKIPYPSFQNNPQLSQRMKISSDYYTYITALKLVQSYGRSIRSESDQAITYVLDSDFKSFVGRSQHILPNWFTEAIKW